MNRFLLQILAALSFQFACADCFSLAEHEKNNTSKGMNMTLEHHKEKYFIGLELKTNNQECSLAMPAHKEKFFKERVKEKIPNKINEDILALYTDYEGDHTKPYSWILGCEVTSLNEVPDGLVGKVIPESKYAVYTTEGLFPQGLIATWQEVWRANLPRAYTSDFEVYRCDFDPTNNPEVKVYVAIKDPLLHSVLQGRLDTFRSGALCSPSPLAAFKERPDNYLYAWGVDYVCGNGIIEKKTDRIPEDKEIDETIAYFSSKNLPFMWWSSAKILETKGFQFGGILTGIALDISQGVPPSTSAPSNLDVKIVQTESELIAFNDLAADAFGMSLKAKEEWLALNRCVMQKDEQIHFIAYLNGVPVGTTTLSVLPTSVGIWSLTTLPEHRKNGIGTALVHATLVEAKKRGYDQVMAILMPKGLAWGLFSKLGFKAVCEFPFYIYGVQADQLEK